MALIQINDTATVKSKAEELASNSVQLESVRQSIEHVLMEVKEYWNQTQQDAQAFTKGLDENVKYLETVIGCNKDFSTTITNYMDVTEKVASTSVGGA